MNERVGPANPDDAESNNAAEPRKRVLIVEDSRDAAHSLALMIRSYSSHIVDIAYTGEDALQQALKFRPQVVLLDIGLPKMNGFQVAERMRQMPETAEAAIIAITGHCQASDLEASEAAGINLHLAKPVELKELLGHLNGASA